MNGFALLTSRRARRAARSSFAHSCGNLIRRFGGLDSVPKMVGVTGKSIPPHLWINYPLTDVFFSNLKWLDPRSPEISIVIVSYKRADLAENLIRSIFLHSAGYRYEIILVDNGSRPGEHDMPARILQNCKLITLPHNHYVGEAYNIGVSQASAPIIVLMNNDIVVEPNWLPPLVEPLLNEAGVGATGPKFLFPSGKLMEAGMHMNPDGTLFAPGRGEDADAPGYSVRREADYCTGATLAMRRESYLQNSGYDLVWAPGYFEDADLCLKLRKQGQKIFYIPESVVFHIEKATMISLAPASDMSQAAIKNQKLFVERWSEFLRLHPTDRPQA